MKYIHFLVGLLWVLMLPISLSAQTSRYVDGDGYTWEVSPSNNNVLQVKNDPLVFDPGLVLWFNNSNTKFTYSNLDLEINGRQYVAGPTNFGDLIEITRKIYVPNTEGWIRVVDKYENLTTNDIVNLRINSENRLRDFEINTTSDKSGTPDWAILTSTNPSNSTVVSLHMSGASSSLDFTLTKTMGGSQGDFYDASTFIDIPANGTVYIMYFASLNNDLQSAEAKSSTLIDPLPAEALFGLKLDELNGILNWDVSTDCAPPVVGFFVSGGCTSESIQFVDNSDIDPQEQSLYTYQWDFGDGTILENETNPTHSYASAGTYNVTLRLIEIGNESCVGISQSTVEVTDPVEITIADNIVICESEGLVDLRQFVSHEGEIIGSFNNFDQYPITENGIFDPASAGPGEFFFEYFLGDLNSCISSAIGSGIVETGGEIGFIDLQPITLFNDQGKCEAFYGANPPEYNSGCQEGLTVSGSIDPGPLSVGTHIVIWSILDGEEVIVSENQEITVVDSEAPVILSEFNISLPVDVGTCAFLLTNELIEATDNCNVGSISFEIEGQESSELVPGEYEVNWLVSDNSGNSTEFNQSITVTNLEGEVQDLTLPEQGEAGESINLSASYNGNTISSAIVDWGDGSSSEASFEGASISATYSYDGPGSFKGRLIVVDICGFETSTTFEITINSNSSEDFFGIIAGGGWFTSLKGNYLIDPNSEGRSIFGFFVLNNSSRKKPNGSIYFYYTGAKLQFRGRAIQSVTSNGKNELVITANGKLNRKNKGSIEITILNTGNSFGNGDKIIVKVFDDSNALVYDNTITNPAGSKYSGRIRVREEEEKKSKNTFTFSREANLLSETSTWNVYPNPAVSEINILPENTSFESVRYQIFDLRGQLMVDKQAGFEANYTPTRISVDELQPGSYILNVIDQSGEILNSQRFIKQ